MRPGPTPPRRRAALRLASSALPLVLLGASDLQETVRRAIVRSAQTADKLDGLWQQISGEVVPGWQSPALPETIAPAARLDACVASTMLQVPLTVASQLTGQSLDELRSRVEMAKAQVVLLYSDDFPRALATQTDISNATVFAFSAFATWRVLQDALPNQPQRALFAQRLGDALLASPALAVPGPPPMTGGGTANSARSAMRLRRGREGCVALLSKLRQASVLQSYADLSGSESYEEEDWEAGGQGSWSYILSGSALVGAARLAQARSQGCSPGDLICAPLAAYLRGCGVPNTVSEYFLDPRGRPDPRTFTDPRYYSQTLIEITALPA